MRGQVVVLDRTGDGAASAVHAHPADDAHLARHGRADHACADGHHHGHHEHGNLGAGQSHSHDDSAPHVHVGDDEAARAGSRVLLCLPQADWAVLPPVWLDHDDPGAACMRPAAAPHRHVPPDGTMKAIRSVRILV